MACPASQGWPLCLWGLLFSPLLSPTERGRWPLAPVTWCSFCLEPSPPLKGAFLLHPHPCLLALVPPLLWTAFPSTKLLMHVSSAHCPSFPLEGKSHEGGLSTRVVHPCKLSGMQLYNMTGAQHTFTEPVNQGSQISGEGGRHRLAFLVGGVRTGLPVGRSSVSGTVALRAGLLLGWGLDGNEVRLEAGAGRGRLL